MKKVFNKVLLFLGLLIVIGLLAQVFLQLAFADSSIQSGNSGGSGVIINCVNTTEVNGTTTPCPVTQGNPPAVNTPTPTPGGNNNNNGGNNSSGGSSSSSTCSDPKPVGTPLGLTAVAGPGPGQVTLYWGPPQGPFTTFSISYSDTPGTQKWGVLDTGDVTSYVISGLGTGNYYFWVRAVNGCAQGDPAGPVTVAGAAGPQVLGANTELSPTPTPKQEVLGTGTNRLVSSAVCKDCIWWPVILLEILAIIVYFWLLVKRRFLKGFLKRKYVWGIIIPVIVYLIFLYINRSCINHVSIWYFINSASFWCKYFWLIDSLVYLMSAWLVKRYLNQNKKPNLT